MKEIWIGYLAFALVFPVMLFLVSAIGFLCETVRMLFDKNYKRQYDITGKLIRYNEKWEYVNWLGFVKKRNK